MDRRQACKRALSNFRADSSHEPAAAVSYALRDKRLHSTSGSDRTHSTPDTSPFRSSTSARTPFSPEVIASSGQPVRVVTTGVRQAMASSAGKENPSVLL